MSNTVLQEVQGVRQMLSNPLTQSPSFKDILEEMEAEYQAVTNQTNNTGNAWQTDNHTLTTVAGTYDYEIAPANGDFYKALNVTTIPSNVDIDPQFTLEFTELEHIPQEWSWLGQNKGQYMYSSHDSQIIAFYRKITSAGAQLRCQIRPTPASVETYNILYQVTDWWPKVDDVADLGFTLPHSSQRFYVRALVAQNLLLKGMVKWSYDTMANYKQGELVFKGLETRIRRYKEQYDEYIDSLDNPDITYISSWADDNVFQDRLY
jgi:hypothetical protein